MLDKEGGGYWSAFGFQFSYLPLLNGSSCGPFVSSYLNNLNRGAAEKSDILTSLSSAPGGKVQTGDFSAGVTKVFIRLLFHTKKMLTTGSSIFESQ